MPKLPSKEIKTLTARLKWATANLNRSEEIKFQTLEKADDAFNLYFNPDE